MLQSILFSLPFGVCGACDEQKARQQQHIIRIHIIVLVCVTINFNGDNFSMSKAKKLVRR